MRIFETNISKVAERLLPSQLYSQNIVAMVRALVAPIESLRGEMLTYRANKKYWIGISPQVCYLEKALNDALDVHERRIWIENTAKNDVLLIHQDQAQQPLMIHTDAYYIEHPEIPVVKVHLDGSYVDGGADFNVNFPFQLSEKEYYTARKILDDNKLPDKSYNFPGQKLY